MALMGVLSVRRDCVRDPLVPEQRALLGNLHRGARQRPQPGAGQMRVFGVKGVRLF